MNRKSFGLFLTSLLCASTLMTSNSYADGIHNFSIRQPVSVSEKSSPALNQVSKSNKNDLEQSTINELDKFAPPTSSKPKSFTYISGRIVVVDVHNDAGRILKILPKVGPSPTANDFVHSVNRSIRGSRVVFDDNITFLSDDSNHLVHPVPFSSSDGGSCFNMVNGDQETFPQGFMGAIVNGNGGLWNIVIDQLFRSDFMRCESTKNHLVFTIDPNSTHGLVPFSYDAKTHSQKILYIGFEKRRSVKANR